MVILLAVGAITPLYEINRAVYRTAQYYFVAGSRATDPEVRITHLPPQVIPELEHPGRLTADALRSLAGLRDELSRNFVADVRGTFFFEFLAGR